MQLSHAQVQLFSYRRIPGSRLNDHIRWRFSARMRKCADFRPTIRLRLSDTVFQDTNGPKMVARLENVAHTRLGGGGGQSRLGLCKFLNFFFFRFSFCFPFPAGAGPEKRAESQSSGGRARWMEHSADCPVQGRVINGPISEYDYLPHFAFPPYTTNVFVYYIIRASLSLSPHIAPN